MKCTIKWLWIVAIVGLVLPVRAFAAAVLTISTAPPPAANPPTLPKPITWNIIGLDSNDVNSGPNEFLAGARVCNTGDATAANLVSTFVWDSSNIYINLLPGSSSTLTASSLAAGACKDFFYNVEITRTDNAKGTSRKFHITATAQGLGTVSTPIGRELYVERLISQNRNGTDSTVISGISCTPGTSTSPKTCNMTLGATATFTFTSHTATGGYEQLTAFVGFPNTAFEILSVSTTYAAPSGATNNAVYADACGWNNDPNDAHYKEGSGGNPGCNLTDNYSGGKAGGDPIVTTYTIRAVGVTNVRLAEVIYDYSGSSYHYNGDFGSCTGTLCANVIIINVVPPTSTPTLTPTPTRTITATPTNTLSPLPSGTPTHSASATPTRTGTYTATSTRTSTATLTPTQTISPTQTATSTQTTTPSQTATNSATNTATQTATHTRTNTPTSTASRSATPTRTPTVFSAPDLALDMTVSVAPVIGQTAVYLLTVTNVGGGATTGPITLVDTLPDGLIFVSASGSGWSCSASGQTVTCTNPGPFAAGASSVVTLVTSVSSAAYPGVTNSGTVSTAGDPNPGNNSDSVSSSVAALPTATATVTSTASATSTATTVPSATASQTASTTPTAVPSETPTRTASATATVAAVPSGTPTRTASATATVAVVPSDTPTRTATAPAAPTSTAGASGPVDLSVLKSHEGTFRVGDNGVYTIDVRNDGGSSTSGVITVTDNLPNGLSFVGGLGAGWSCSASGQLVTCVNSGPLLPGQTSRIRLTVAIGQAAYPTLTNWAWVATVGDDNASNNGDSAPTTIQLAAATATPTAVAGGWPPTPGVGSQCGLSIGKSQIGSPEPGGLIQYRLVWAASCGGASGVAIQDALPSGVDFVSVDAPGATVQTSGNIILLQQASVGETAQYATILARVNAGLSPGALVCNDATLSDVLGRGAIAESCMRIISPGEPARIEIHGHDLMRPGREITYTGRYFHATESNQLTLTLPPGVTIVRIDDPQPDYIEGRTVYWRDVPTVSGKVRVTAALDYTAVPGVILSALMTFTDQNGSDVVSHDTVVVRESSPSGDSTIGSLSLTGPRSVNPGLPTTLMVRYSKVVGPAYLGVHLAPGLHVTETLPPAEVQIDGSLVWHVEGGTRGVSGSAKILMQVADSAAVGSILSADAEVDTVDTSAAASREFAVRQAVTDSGTSALTLKAVRSIVPGATTDISVKFKAMTAPVNLNLELPPELTPVLAIPAIADFSDGKLRWDFARDGGLMTGSAKIRVRLDSNVPVGSTLTLLATANSPDASVASSSVINVRTGAASATGEDSNGLNVTGTRDVVAGLTTTISIRYQADSEPAQLVMLFPPETFQHSGIRSLEFT